MSDEFQLGESFRALDRDLLPGFKKPDTFRLAPPPLYTTYTDLWQAVATLRDLTER